MENKCPKCGEDFNYCNDDYTIDQDGDTLCVNYWCHCKSCGEHWRYVEKFTLDIAWIETNEED